MKPLIYIETSVISYLTARTSRDVLTAARQTWTREWWDIAHQHWIVKASELVVEESSTLSGAHYLVSWNFAHLVGPDKKIKLLDTIRALGQKPALLTTPEELMEMLP